MKWRILACLARPEGPRSSPGGPGPSSMSKLTTSKLAQKRGSETGFGGLGSFIES